VTACAARVLAQLPDPRDFVNVLKMMPRLECVFLNACQTLDPGRDADGKSLGEHIVEARPAQTGRERDAMTDANAMR
jgi:hypothetical protein